ncbi:MAG: hypothetical protein PVI90_01475 [Desulfobacteraceae bacterium]|jgi:hypothetical protein
MDLKKMNATPSWNWPEDAHDKILSVLTDPKALPFDRLLAAKLAGDHVVLSDEIAHALLNIAKDSKSKISLRCQAVTSLGPALEGFDIYSDDGFDEVPISEETFTFLQKSLRKLYLDANVPEKVRRRIMEASVHAPQGWHQNAVRAAYFCKDPDWKLTSVFCMSYVKGFDDLIIESLRTNNQNILYHAIRAAGNWAVDKAWPHMAALVRSKKTSKPILLAAIDAVVYIRPHMTSKILRALTFSKDRDIVEAANKAMILASGPWDRDDLGADC